MKPDHRPPLKDLLPILLRLTLSDSSDSECLRFIEASPQSAGAWQALHREANAHRVGPLFAHVLSRRGLESRIPSEQRSALGASYRRTRRANTMQMWVLKTLLPLLSEQGISPIMFKGMVLSDVYYPDLGTRPMGDIDLLVHPEEREAVAAALSRCGLQPVMEKGVIHKTNFRDALGVTVDLHQEFLLFPPEGRDRTTEEVVMPGLDGQVVRTWEPNAMLIHLIVHLSGHQPDTGFLLGWLMDIAFLVRKRGEELRLSVLEGLSPSDGELSLLWRVLGFLEVDCGLQIPSDLSGAVSGKKPLSLPGIRRDRRLALWGLPGMRGWYRLLACGVGVRERPPWAYPEASDLVLGLIPGGRE